MDSPLFSIVINNYNYGAYLEQAIDSALAQTYRPLEIVVVDDGSTDDSRQRIESYGDRIHPIFQQNSGQTMAMNTGLANAKGEFVIFLDSDDLLSPDAAERAYRIFQEDSSCVLIHWQMKVIDASSKPTGKTMPALAPDEGKHLAELVLTYGPNSFRRVPTSGNAHRRNYVDQVSPFPNNERELNLGSAGVDAYLSNLAPLFGSVCRLPEPSGAYRVHGKNSFAASDFDGKIDRLIRIYESYCKELARVCDKQGIGYSKSLWGTRSWPHRLAIALDELQQAIDLDQPFILIDEMQWGMTATEQRRVIPFLEKDGVYWGRPGSDREAIEAVERIRKDGARAVVVAWPAFWWLDHYPLFANHLQQSAACVLDNERVKVFDLTVNPAPSAQPAP